MSEPIKCVFVVSSSLSIGQAMNCCSLLAANLGAKYPDFIGEAPADADGVIHSGLCSVPISVLKAAPEMVREIRLRLDEDREIDRFDVTSISQKARQYSEVIEWTRAARTSDLEYVGVGLIGPKSRVVRFTGDLELYR